ncbi:hypothetical protein [Microbacterium aurum]|uniref:hypothetical protein n=1 Tax=Microbacterium aurum TaxID=36805 RepID=UPI0012F4B46E|nr:hypothetical protein [Microbacterium aurum]MBM7828532.1 hypothetical protein [Microbacterium aurum]
MHLTKATSRTVLSFFAIATAFTLATATPATASGFDTSANPTAETDEGVIFSVLGDVGDGVGSIVSDEELAQLGIEVTPGTASSTPTVQAEPAPTARAAATNNVLFRWNDFGGRQVVLRSQPYDKILNKHNLTYRTPRVVTQKATTRTPDGGTSWRYRLAANEVKCDFWGNNCKVVRTVWVRTIVDFRSYQGDKYGVVTAYCEGIDGKCPDFVKNALNQ